MSIFFWNLVAFLIVTANVHFILPTIFMSQIFTHPRRNRWIDRLGQVMQTAWWLLIPVYMVLFFALPITFILGLLI
jgi:hypothetical protein